MHFRLVHFIYRKSNKYLAYIKFSGSSFSANDGSNFDAYLTNIFYIERNFETWPPLILGERNATRAALLNRSVRLQVNLTEIKWE